VQQPQNSGPDLKLTGRIGPSEHLGDIEVGGAGYAVGDRGEPTGFSRIAAPLMASAMARATRKDLAALKRLLEAAG